MDRLAVKSVKEHRQPPTEPRKPVERQNMRQSKRLPCEGAGAAETSTSVRRTTRPGDMARLLHWVGRIGRARCVAGSAEGGEVRCNKEEFAVAPLTGRCA